jgi:hypothetical protein
LCQSGGYIPFADAPERLTVIVFILPDRERDAGGEGVAGAARPIFRRWRQFEQTLRYRSIGVWRSMPLGGAPTMLPTRGI